MELDELERRQLEKAEFLAVREARKATLWHSLGLKERILIALDR